LRGPRFIPSLQVFWKSAPQSQKNRRELTKVVASDIVNILHLYSFSFKTNEVISTRIVNISFGWQASVSTGGVEKENNQWLFWTVILTFLLKFKV